MSQAQIIETNDDLNWSNVQKDLINQYGESTFTNWFSKLHLISSSVSEITFSVPTNFMKEWINTYYLDSIKNYWRKYNKLIINVNVVVKIPKDNIITKNENRSFFDKPIVSSNDDLLVSSLDNRFKFNNFLLGKSNEFAYAASFSVAENNTNNKSNPLFLYGGVGLGKTHLMQSIAWHIYENNPIKKVIYMSAEKFMYQFVRAIRNRDVINFKEKFRNIDILIIDDIQFICGKDSTQEEFFHTFESLISQGKQIVISCDRTPNDLENIGDQIKSRLSGGLIADISNADIDLRLKIIKNKASKSQFDIPLNVLEFLSENIYSNIRELEGALNKIIAYANLSNLEININNTKRILHDILDNNIVISIPNIQHYISKFYNISFEDLVSTNKIRRFVKPRHIAIYLSKMLTQKSLIEISKEFKRKDHTTIMHAIKNITILKTKDRIFSQELESIICNLRK